MVGRAVRFLGTVVAAAAALVLAGAPAAPAGDLAAGQDKFKVGDKAPDFAVKDLAGAEVRLSSFTGSKVVLLNFWGLRCGACLEEMPYLEKIAAQYGPRGLVTLGVNTDGVDAATVLETLAEIDVKVSYPLLCDPEFTVTDLYTNYLVPLTIVIDKAGAIRYIHTGFEAGTEKAYEDAVRKALGS